MAMKIVFIFLTFLLANAVALNENRDVNCLIASTKIKSCYKFIFSFILRIEQDLNQGCCHAISTIAEHCWPTTLINFGFTFDESKMLQNQCHVTSSSLTAPPPPKKNCCTA